jgi:hypothetical protein
MAQVGITEAEISKFGIRIIAVQNEWHSLRFALILLDFSINIHPSQNQVHCRGAEITEGCFLLIQSREARDWIKSLFPSGLRSKIV